MICLKHLEEIAKGIVETTKRHSPQIFFEQGDKIVTALLVFEGDDCKEIAIEKARELVLQHNPERYVIIMDAYISGNPTIRPSQDPNRKSCLIINQFTKDGKQNAIIVNVYENKNNEIVWLDRQIVTDDIGQINSTWNFYKEYITVNGIPFNVDFGDKDAASK